MAGSTGVIEVLTLPMGVMMVLRREEALAASRPRRAATSLPSCHVASTCHAGETRQISQKEQETRRADRGGPAGQSFKWEDVWGWAN